MASRPHPPTHTHRAVPTSTPAPINRVSGDQLTHNTALRLHRTCTLLSHAENTETGGGLPMFPAAPPAPTPHQPCVPHAVALCVGCVRGLDLVRFALPPQLYPALPRTEHRDRGGLADVPSCTANPHPSSTACPSCGGIVCGVCAGVGPHLFSLSTNTLLLHRTCTLLSHAQNTETGGSSPMFPAAPLC